MKSIVILFSCLYAGTSLATSPMPTPEQLACVSSAQEANLIGAGQSGFVQACIKTLNTADNAAQ